MKLRNRMVAWVNKRCPAMMASLRYRKYCGKWPDLKNPNDINEIILWEKLNLDPRIWVPYADKYRVRDYVKSKGLKDILIPLYGVWKSPDEIEWDLLPQSAVYKTNSGGGTLMSMS